MLQVLVLATVASFSGVKVRSVHDGDTFSVNLPRVPALLGQNLGIRINGIDTAELRDEKECARQDATEARETLKLLLQTSEHVELIDCSRDKFYRLRCTVRTDSGVDVSAFMIKSGLAVPYSGGTRQPWRCVR
jgi:micrococcal nuclease